MKEDVEKAVPPKEEIIIEVEVFHVGLVVLKILDLLLKVGVSIEPNCDRGCVSAQNDDIWHRP